jgi:hypothetical protein
MNSEGIPLIVIQRSSFNRLITLEYRSELLSRLEPSVLCHFRCHLQLPIRWMALTAARVVSLAIGAVWDVCLEQRLQYS